MFLKDKTKGDLVEILSLQDLFNPFKKDVVGRFHSGEEVQDPEEFSKAELCFPSGEELPQCWIDHNYRSHSLFRHA